MHTKKSKAKVCGFQVIVQLPFFEWLYTYDIAVKYAKVYWRAVQALLSSYDPMTNLSALILCSKIKTFLALLIMHIKFVLTSLGFFCDQH